MRTIPIIRMGISRAATLLAWAACGAEAQSVAQLGVSAGSATDERGVRSSAVTLAPVVVFAPRPRTNITLGGTATRFQSEGWMAGGSATVASSSDEIAGISLSLNAGVGMSRSSFGTTLTVADATPAIEWHLSDVTFFGGARAASGHTSARAPAAQPVPVPGQGSVVTASRSSVGPVFGGQWQPSFAATWPTTLSYREERATVDGVRATDRSAATSIDAGTFAVGGVIGERVTSSERSRFASASMSIALVQSVRLEGAAGRYLSDRLTGTAPGRFVSVGLAFRFGGGDPHLPTPRGVSAPAPGQTRLTILAGDARTVDVYGDWNDWTPVRAVRATNGVWYVDVPLSPGEYRYAFRINEVEWRVPDGAVTADDGFGGKSAYVTVVRPTAQHGTGSREDG